MQRGATNGLDVVCFSANDWEDIPSSKLHIMKYLGEANRVLFVDTIGIRNPRPNVRDARRVFTKARAIAVGVRQVSENVWVLSPPAFPFHGSSAARALNERIVSAAVRSAMHRLGMNKPLVWSYLPHAAPIIRRLPRCQVVYHCIDDFAAMTGAPARALEELEAEMCELADVIAASSSALASRLGGHGKQAIYVPHAVNPTFARSIDRDLALPDIDTLPRPRAGFVGRIGDWIDLPLLERAADELPSWSFVLIGPAIVDTTALARRPNVALLGRREYDVIPTYASRLDVAVIPYRGSANQNTRNPLKMYEYLAVGLPVVATHVREAATLGDLVRLASPDEFVEALRSAVSTDSSDLRERRQAAVSTRSWGDVAEEILLELRGSQRVAASA